MLQVLKNTIIKPVKDYYNLSNVSNLNNNINNIDSINNIDNIDSVNNIDNINNFDGNWVQYEDYIYNDGVLFDGYQDKNNRFKPKTCLTDEYENARYDAHYVRTDKIHEFIKENKLREIECHLIEGRYYINPNGDIYKIDWTFYEKLEDLLDHTNLFQLLNDEQIIHFLHDYEYKKNLFQQSITNEEINKRVEIDNIIENVIYPSLDKKEQEFIKRGKFKYHNLKEYNCVIC